MQISHDMLPPRAQELADVIGLDGLLKLVDHYGGLTVSVPTKYSPGNQLESCLLREKFQKLIEIYRGERIDVPMLTAGKAAIRHQSVIDSLQHGETRSSTAYQHGMTERNVYKIQRRNRDSNDDQGNLF